MERGSGHRPSPGFGNVNVAFRKQHCLQHPGLGLIPQLFMIPAAAMTFTRLSISMCITNPSVIVLGPGRGIGSTWRWCPRFPIVFREPFKLQRVATGCLHWEIHHSSGCCSGSNHSPAKLFVATERWVIHTATQPSELNFSWPTMLLRIGKRKRRKKIERERESKQK